MDNYMDKFSSPEEYIRAEVCANRGTKNVIDKDELIFMLGNEDPDYPTNGKTKGELWDRLVEVLGKDAYDLVPVGVSSFHFQLKFFITNADVKKMAKHGFIAITGAREFRMYGKTCYANTYSPYDYFRLTPEEVHAWLEAHSRKKKEETKNGSL